MADAVVTDPPKPRRPRWNDRNHRMIYAWIPNEAYAALESAAAKRNEHVDVLVARMLQLIAADNVIDAVLDDKS